MRVFNQGAYVRVTVSPAQQAAFASRWPGSQLPLARTISFTFDRRNGDLVDLSPDVDGDDIVALSQDAQNEAMGKGLLTNPRVPPLLDDETVSARISAVYDHPQWDWRVVIVHKPTGRRAVEYVSGGRQVAEAIARRMARDIMSQPNPRHARTRSGRIRELIHEGTPDGHGQAGAIAYRETRAGKLAPNPRRRRVPTGNAGQFFTEVWEERDRLHISLYFDPEHEGWSRSQQRSQGDGYLVVQWWDDEAREMFTDGFFKSGRGLDASVIAYANEVGLIHLT